MSTGRKILTYLLLALLLGAAQGFMAAVFSPLAGLLHPGQVPLEPIGMGMLLGLSPVFAFFEAATGLLFPSLETLIAITASLVHLYFIRNLEFNYEGVWSYLFEVFQVVSGPIAYVFHFFHRGR